MIGLRSRGRDEQGAILVFVSIAMVAMIGATALALDIGQLTNKNRDLQAVADVVALDTARAINGTSVGVLSAPTGAVTVAAQNSAGRNNFPFAQLEVQLGAKTGTADFVHLTDPSAIPNAVRIIANATIDFDFAPGDTNTSRRAVAVPDAEVSFSVGSFLAGISAKDDTVLHAIFGDSFGASVLSYQGLANAHLTLEAIGLNFPLGVLTPAELLTTQIEAEDLFIASADALRLQGNTAAADVLDALALSITSATLITLGDTLVVDSGGEQAAATAQLNVLQMLTAAALFIDGTHAITIPQAQLGIPGIGNVVLSLNVIEPAQTVTGRVGAIAETSQVSLTVTPQITLTTAPEVNACSLRDTLGALLSLSANELLKCTLGEFVGRVVTLDLNASVPIALEAAGAKATLTDITCTSPQSITLTPEPQPLTVTSNVDLTFTGTLLSNNLGDVLRVRGTAGAAAASTAPPQVFAHPSQFGTPRTVGSNPLGLADLTTFTASDVHLLDADLEPVLSTLTPPVLSLVNTTLGELDAVLMGPLNDLLGLNLGGADLTAITGSLTCDGVRLAE